MKIGDVVRFQYGDANLIGTVSKDLLLNGWYLIEVEKPRMFRWKNEDPFHVMMHIDALELIK